VKSTPVRTALGRMLREPTDIIGWPAEIWHRIEIHGTTWAAVAREGREDAPLKDGRYSR